MNRFRPNFDEGRALIVARPFVYKSRKFERNQPFDWRDLGYSAPEVARLYNARRLRHAPVEEVADVAVEADAPRKRGRPKKVQATIEAP